MSNPQPQLVVVAGPNGAGKSTLAERLVPQRFGMVHYVNADVIARGLSAFRPESVAIEAGRVMLERLDALASQRADFAFETTLSGRTYARWISRLQSSGYLFHLLFVTLNRPELSIERVAKRVSLGGHDVPADVIRRRFKLGILNLFELNMPLADTWSVYDNSTGGNPRLVAIGQRQTEPNVIELNRWQELCRYRDDSK
ncbi:MAG TPA: zeta toxin family protein [Pirellulales bacterium]|jgi:predicted ABC-type ATPase|nr:zeta toxin family protein [Pirellulales bacterium]